MYSHQRGVSRAYHIILSHVCSRGLRVASGMTGFPIRALSLLSLQLPLCAAGCPELAPSGVGKQAIQSYTKEGLDTHDVGEAAYRLLINPAPPLRNLIMSDSQFGQIIPMMCR